MFLLRGTILASHSLGTNSSGSDVSIFSGSRTDWMFINAPAYHSVHVYKISGPGHFDLIQRYDLDDMPEGIVATAGFAVSAVSSAIDLRLIYPQGQAVYHKGLGRSAW